MATVVDPLVQAVTETAEPWGAYQAAVGIGDSFVDEVDWMPHGGSLYATWAELTDLFDTGKTPLADAHRVLTQAAAAWLDRSDEPSAEFLAAWLERAQSSTGALVRRYGDFWRDPAPYWVCPISGFGAPVLMNRSGQTPDGAAVAATRQRPCGQF